MQFFSPLKMGLTVMSRTRFKQSRNPSLVTQFYGLEFFARFWVYSRGDSFSQRSGIMKRNKKY